ncbi:hypothetical protein HU200_064608 [Digitaria exilis]|uniref:Chalcone synthase n=1 Tax=Digitaria exilis TaxID=1010633 RepID=A0A834ZZ85_9POAL|nr:hypothetical protein HU200_064608 [Digitaria exilis]
MAGLTMAISVANRRKMPRCRLPRGHTDFRCKAPAAVRKEKERLGDGGMAAVGRGLLVSTTTQAIEASYDHHGRATIMGIGKAVPEHVFEQKSYADYYFDVTNSNHMVDLKAKFASICENTMVEKRHFYMSDDTLRSNPSITAYKSPSFTLRQELADEGVPRLGAAAALNAINDWGKQASDITHLVLSTLSSGCLPGADCELVHLLGLPPSTKRVMLYQAACHGGGAALRLSKDLAESNPGARVLVVCSEVTPLWLRGPSPSHVGNLVGQAIFGDAAGAVIVGSDPGAGERGLFELVWTWQEIVPGTRDGIVAKLRDEGLVFTLHRDVPRFVAGAVAGCVQRALRELAAPEVKEKDDMFWVVHAGGRGVLDMVQSEMGLGVGKLAASRSAMRQYGNTLSSSVVLVMEEMRRTSEEKGMRTAGQGLDWGLLLAFGPGITVETILLRALPDYAKRN